MVMYTDEFLEKLCKGLNKGLMLQRRRLVLVKSSQDVPSPKPRFGRTFLLKYEQNKKSLEQMFGKKMFVSVLSDTNSMDGVMDSGHLALISEGIDEKDLIVGDVISFFYDDNNPRILHRIIEIGKDKFGWFCYTRGDNVTIPEGKIRKEQLNGVLLGLLY